MMILIWQRRTASRLTFDIIKLVLVLYVLDQIK